MGGALSTVGNFLGGGLLGGGGGMGKMLSGIATGPLNQSLSMLSGIPGVSKLTGTVVGGVKKLNQAMGGIPGVAWDSMKKFGPIATVMPGGEFVGAAIEGGKNIERYADILQGRKRNISLGAQDVDDMKEIKRNMF